MELSLIGEIFGCGESQSRSDDSFNCWIIGQVQEQHHSLHRSVLFEIGLEETSDLHVNTHSSEHHTEVFIRVISYIFTLHQAGLTHNLSTDFVVRETIG